VRMHDSGNFFTIDDFTAEFVSGNPTNVPEPVTLVLAALGLGGLGIIRRRSSNI
ncbi:MAG: PEP-CTERM sorting domain-containing protein, partial [Gammaproteobacteria bacterium]|nr:PEP-CTERM sorting domain-containing protein [Gammaproteobacteria bacterium]